MNEVSVHIIILKSFICFFVLHVLPYTNQAIIYNGGRMEELVAASRKIKLVNYS